MSQASAATRIMRFALGLILIASLVSTAWSAWSMWQESSPSLNQFAPPPMATVPDESTLQSPVPTHQFERPLLNNLSALQNLITSTLMALCSALFLLMSKYTEWQRARLEQTKLAIELKHKELELQTLSAQLKAQLKTQAEKV